MTTHQPLEAWGWNGDVAASFATTHPSPVAAPARVIGQERDRWVVQTDTGSQMARITGYQLGGLFPVTGDWVLVEAGPLASDLLSITGVLPRRTVIARGAAGEGERVQLLAANVDVVWIVHGLDSPLNARRIERYLTAAWESGATPEVVLTKADLVDDAANRQSMIESVAIGVPVHVVTTRDPAQIAAFRGTLHAACTYALLGPSGAGKSSLVNALADETLALTGAVREVDHKGRHTTTRRELFRIAGGALLLDTPGLREFRVWSAEQGLAHTFPEIDALAQQCRFRDCRHEAEPGCAVLAAANSEAIDPARLTSYRKLLAESAYLDRRDDPEAQAAAVAKHKTALKTMKYHHKRQGP
jgi:ribosome biogenesis GTPase / thiamine phosphate phosphatase